MPRVRISPWKAAVPAAFIVLAVSACNPSAGSSAPSASPSSAPPSSALCRDLTDLYSTVTSFAHQTSSSVTSSTISADGRLLTTELNNVAQAAQGRFAPQADGLKSALGTLLTELKGFSDGTATKTGVKNAAENVVVSAADLSTATRSACPSADAGSG
jgi:hypothetical protein